MTYIRWLRAQVGPAPLLVVYATAIIRDEQGRVLFQRRADFGVWGLPGGVLEPGESVLDTLRREAREETGLLVEPSRFVGLYTSPDFTVTYPNGDIVQQVTAAFECHPVGAPGREGIGAGAAFDLSEVLEQRFIAPEKAPAVLPWYARMLADVGISPAVVTRDRRGGSGVDPPTAGAAVADVPATAGRETVDRLTVYNAGAPVGPPSHREGIMARLRSHVGTEPLVMPCASAVVLDGAGRILLIRRADNGLWALPAGAMELGERIDRSAVRETLEETGVEVRPVRLAGLYSGGENRVTYPNGDRVWLVVASFLCEALAGEARPDGVETLEAAWFRRDDLPLDASPFGRRVRRRVDDALSPRLEAACD